MKVLFVASGNTKNQDIVPFIKSQGVSLVEAGIQVSYFPIVGKGLRGYLKSVPKLKAWLNENPTDLIHAHYSLCGWVAVLAAGKIPVVLSLMGDDAYGTFNGANKIEFKSRFLIFLTWLIQPFVHAIIYKSPNIASAIYRKKIAHHIPNGVHFQQFKLYEDGCHEALGLQKNKQYVLFLGNPDDPRKNYALAAAAVQKLNRPDIALLAPYPIPHDTVVQYFNTVDAFVLCSFAEGSPNVVKEAMVCNCPLVATNVGDVTWLLGDTPGCYVSSFEVDEFAKKLAQCLDFSAITGRTSGRERMLKLGLDAQTVAQRVLAVYEKVIDRKAFTSKTSIKIEV